VELITEGAYARWIPGTAAREHVPRTNKVPVADIEESVRSSVGEADAYAGLAEFQEPHDVAFDCRDGALPIGRVQRPMLPVVTVVQGWDGTAVMFKLPWFKPNRIALALAAAVESQAMCARSEN
jgi:hypothetical protein